MDDRDLNRLKDIAAPEPAAEARARALDAAMLAFDAEQQAEQKNIGTASQGSGPLSRLTSVFENLTWSSVMEKRVALGAVAASLLLAPVAVHFVQNPAWWRSQELGLDLTEAEKKKEVAVVEAANERVEGNAATSSQPAKQITERAPSEEVARLAARPDQSGPKPADLREEDAVDVASAAPPANPPMLAAAPEPAPPASGGAENLIRPLADSVSPLPEPKTPSVAESEASPVPVQRSSRFRIKSKTDTAVGQIRGLIEQDASKTSVFTQPTQTAETPGKQAFRQALSQPARKQIATVRNAARSGVIAPPSKPDPRIQPREQSRDAFEKFEVNPVKTVSSDPVSTFSIDVDTASYAFVRRMIRQGRLPNPDAVRVEEMINYFSYDYPRPESKDAPFKPSVAVYPTPWNEHTKLMHIGIKGHQIVPAEKPRSNLVFLIDVSGSMSSQDKLPLLRNAFRLLVNKLGAEDTVSIVTYAGNAGTVLEPTKGSERHKILAALDRLRSGGSTAGAQGIRQAYALAESAFVKGGVNRVILATDGDFNVGITDRNQLKSYIATKRKSGVFLSVLGFGQGNYNDALMQALAQNGNGNAAYIDTLNEARKVLVTEAGSTLYPIAKDVKIQIEFNPSRIAEYRLIGYETRALRREDFRNDKVDAGDIGSGHTVTAIYEITPKEAVQAYVNPLRYGAAKSAEPAPAATDDEKANEYAFLKMRYKLPNEEKSKLLEVPVTTALESNSVEAISTDMRFAAAVAAFGQKLRSGRYLGDYGYARIIQMANAARGKDEFGHRAEFVNLVRLAQSLDASPLATPQQ